jgi:hypothetical protein
MAAFWRFIKFDALSHHVISQQHGPIGDEVTLVLCNGKRVSFAGWLKR